MSDENKKPELYLLLETEIDKGWHFGSEKYGHVTLKVVTLEYDPKTHEHVPTGLSAWQSEPYNWTSFRIYSQLDNRVREEWPHVYGWHCEFQPYSFRLDNEGEAMVKTLKFVEHGLKRLNGKLGWAQSFDEWVARIGLILKVKGLVQRNTSQHQEMSGYTWRTVAPSEIRHTVRNAVLEVAQTLNPEKVT